jgi:hypothetical protein
MKFKAVPFRALPCNLEVFEVNGRAAEKDDFGYSEDWDSYSAEPYGCGDMTFVPYKVPPEGVLKKYEITEEEWGTVAESLKETLYVGQCGWCV